MKSRGSSQRSRYPGYLKIHKGKRMRVLDFSKLEHPKEVYETLYQSTVNTPRGYEGATENRTIGKVFDKLEKIGVKEGEEYKLENTGVEVKLEDAEYSLVMEALKVIKFRGQFSRLATEMFEW